MKVIGYSGFVLGEEDLIPMVPDLGTLDPGSCCVARRDYGYRPDLVLIESQNEMDFLLRHIREGLASSIEFFQGYEEELQRSDWPVDEKETYIGRQTKVLRKEKRTE